MRALVLSLVGVIVVFMTATLVIALTQEQLDWGWWWAVPMAGFFLVAIIGFRILVQKAAEAAEREDRRADEQIRRGADGTSPQGVHETPQP